MTLPRYEAMLEYWETYPPVHISAAIFLGIKPKQTPAAPPNHNDPLEEFSL